MHPPEPPARRAPPPAAAGTAPPRVVGNAFGLLEACVGIVAGFLLASLAAGTYLQVSGHPKATDSLGAVVLSLCGLWTGLVGAALVATRTTRTPAAAAAAGGPAGDVRLVPARRLSADLGLRLRLWPDVPLGVAIGVASQYGLVWALEELLTPFVHNLSQQVGKPAQQLTSGVYGWQLVVLALFVCVGSPLVEELYFRGLLLRALFGVTSRFGPVLRPLVSIGLTSLLFALAHFEAIQFIGLAGFGAVLGVLAWRTGRLGPGIVAHASFNAVAVISIVVSRHGAG